MLQVGHLSDPQQGRRGKTLATALLRAIRTANSWREDVLRRDLLFAARCLGDVGQLGVEEVERQLLLTELVKLWRTTPFDRQREYIHYLFVHFMGTPNGEFISSELFSSLKDSDRAIRRLAATALGQVGAAGKESSVEALQLAVKDDDREVRLAAEAALTRMSAGGGDCPGQGDPYSLEEVSGEAPQTVAPGTGLSLPGGEQTSAGGRTSGEERRGKIRGGLGLPPLVRDEERSPETLLTDLSAADVSVRVAAAEALGRLAAAGGTQSLEGLLLALKDVKKVVRRAAAEALGRFGPAAGAHALEALLTAMTDDDVYVRRAAARALGQLGPAGGERSRNALLAAATDDDKYVRAAATTAIGQLGVVSERDVEALLNALEDEAPIVRFKAAEVLGKIEQTPANNILDVLAEFWSKHLDNRDYHFFSGNYLQVKENAFQELTRIADARMILS
jgi:HEAT repeat protein